MRLKNIPGSREAIAESKYIINEEFAPYVGRPSAPAGSVKGSWASVFGNENPIRAEIGMGKGMFITEQARRNPDINFVGIEKYSSVLLRAVQKQDALQLPNIRFIRMEAEYIENVFEPGEIDHIYLNFSDPWPKKRTAKRRLTSRQFLARYQNILPVGGIIEFKTDNVSLFDFSLAELWETGAKFTQEALCGASPLPKEFGPDSCLQTKDNYYRAGMAFSSAATDSCAGLSAWRVLAATRDLHASPMNEGNIMTEYELRFSEAGNKICKYIIEKIHQV